jgi:indolepyruvate decarboxylase
MLAEPARRHLLFIGDGSFQMTAQELSTMLRQGFKPVVFVMNNRGYTIERVILGPHSSYNDVQNWCYAEFPKTLAAGSVIDGFRVRTEAELETALDRASTPQAFTLIKLELDPLDAPAGLQRMGPIVADFDFGERGPQERINVGLRGKA